MRDEEQLRLLEARDRISRREGGAAKGNKAAGSDVETSMITTWETGLRDSRSKLPAACLGNENGIEFCRGSTEGNVLKPR
jgi:hypothetical protein